jgi:hypothetical protein
MRPKLDSLGKSDNDEDEEELINRLLEDDTFKGGANVLTRFVGLVSENVLLDKRKDDTEVRIKVLVV